MAACIFGSDTRIRDRFHRPVVSVAILADERARWRPARYETALWGCDVRFRYPVIKLRDYRSRLTELEASRNPFATMVLAHPRAQETQRDPAARARAKLGLIRRLYDHGYASEEIRELFRLIDWLLRLPEEREEEVWRVVRTIEEERQMPYVTSVERRALRKGLLAGLEQILDLKFGEEGRRAFDDVRHIEDLSVLEAVIARLRTATNVDEIRALYQSRNA